MVVDVILIITGIVILVASVIFAGNKTEDSGDDSFFTNELNSKKNMVDDMVKSRIETLTEEAIVNTDDALSKISNEKIMAINEFSETNLEKIQENHDHVVFLYNMLNAKDDEIKQTLSEMENSKQGMKDTVNEVVRITRQLNTAVKKNSKLAESDPQAQKNLENIKKPLVNATKNPQKEQKEKADFRKSSAVMADEATGQMNLPELMQSDNKNEEILRLHKAGKSILDISKELNLGQGEVKLVIDLYGA
ncbi:MAG: hypothetical protein K6F63_10235 [Lachnospiraceae bacterium]|nr:hypothetical protein [Lachnospiraceae bacterium]